MKLPTRRHLLRAFIGPIALAGLSGPTFALTESERRFAAEAARMRQVAERAGDQAFGAIVVLADDIVGWGPSRVVADRNPDAHAERVALWDAQRRLGRLDLPDCVIYSTSRPCVLCEAALASAAIAAMRYGPNAVDAGRPMRR